MTQAVLTQSSQPSIASRLANLVLSTGLQAAVGAGAAALFTSINPAGGAVFGATSGLTGGIVNWICDQAGICENNTIAQTGKCAVSLITSIGVGVFVTTALGFPISFTAGVILTAAIIATAIAITLAVAGAFCSTIACGAIAAGNCP